MIVVEYMVQKYIAKVEKKKLNPETKVYCVWMRQ